MQKPWNVNLTDRYILETGGVHHMWVFSDD
jgi:hypothetical protein